MFIAVRHGCTNGSSISWEIYQVTDEIILKKNVVLWLIHQFDLTVTVFSYMSFKSGYCMLIATWLALHWSTCILWDWIWVSCCIWKLMSVAKQPQIGLPHLVYLTDEGIFSSVCAVKSDSASETYQGFLERCCCCFKFFQNMRINNEKKISGQIPGVCS